MWNTNDIDVCQYDNDYEDTYKRSICTDSKVKNTFEDDLGSGLIKIWAPEIFNIQKGKINEANFLKSLVVDILRSDRSHAITAKNKSLTYDSWTDRRERRSGLARSSEPTGSEKIPKARSISRTTDAVRRAARISVNEEDLRPRSVREYRAPLAMVVPASGTPR
ncbi:hypothetical protein B296_00039584 [Ensete ventricosum]|uniref:Uncharacterized protein n=1 Tax=Ensete ventricosum TaxID=4639 RepID=A0A426ZT68_ENSVE|nr:hypothetical protein B296_00039584 [Ensete ventricosum]